MINKKASSLSETLSTLPVRIVSSSEASFALFACLLAIVLNYRIQLTIGLFTNSVRPFDFNPAHHPVWFMLGYMPCDLAIVLVCFLTSWLLSRAQCFSIRGKFLTLLKVSGFVFLNIFLVILLLVHGIHGRLLFDVQTGLDTSVIMEAVTSVSFHEVTKLIRIKDYLILLFPIALFWLVLLLPLVFKIWIGRISFPIFILLLLVSPFLAEEKASTIPSEIRINPALFLLSGVAENGFNKQSAEGRLVTSVAKNGSGIQPTDPVYTTSINPLPFLPAPGPHPWNIVFFIMESVGARYTFDTSYGNQMPMPFLHSISRKGWYLRQHFTASNVSTKAVFSLLSGRYDFFGRENFGTQSNASAPALYNFFPTEDERFLVTPSSISWYFPAAFVKNSGLSEIHSFETLPFKKMEEYNSLGHYIARDEYQTVDFFIQRLARAKEPFVAMYISFAAHFPYFDHGPDYRIMEKDGGLLNRYTNNLNFLDQMIKRIYDHLEKQGRLERTIFVIVGDHGQAFGQHHPNNYMHYRYSYNENLETPAIIYQPALFRPKVFEMPTSHVDLLPTLLDAMRIPYNPLLFDGESLFHRPLRRTYIYAYGLEESITSLDRQQIKVQYSLKKNKCWAFDLTHDPDEKDPLDCSSYQQQLEALHNFVSYHNLSLVEYNATIRENRDFQGQRHPSF